MNTSMLEIIDKQNIEELQNHYSYSIDSGKYDNLDEMFTPKAIYNFITGFTDNIEALKQKIREALEPLKTSQHINGNHWAEIEGGLCQSRMLLYSPYASRGIS